MADVTLTVDGDSVAVPPGTTILKAAEQLGRQIPTICSAALRIDRKSTRLNSSH